MMRRLGIALGHRPWRYWFWGPLALGLLVLLWRASGRHLEEGADRPVLIMRLIYAGGIGLMLYGVLTVVSTMLLLGLRLID